jgi:tape measure domain-containing protein
MIDFSSGTGQSVETMKMATLALGQIKAKGKLAGQEILQLVNAGVPVVDILGKMGFTLDDVSKGLVKADDFVAAFNETLGGDFAGAAKRATNSWAGLMSSFEDIKKIGLRTLFADTFTALQPLVVEFSSWMQSEGMAKLEDMGKNMGNFTKGLIDGLNALKSMSGADIISAIGDKSVALSDAFKQWARNVDWQAVSDEIVAGINSIDWAKLGQDVRTVSANMWKGVSEAAKEIDWASIGNAIASGTGNVLAGLTGQGNLANVLTTWANVGAAGAQIVSQLQSIISQWQQTTATGIANWALGIRASLVQWQASTSSAIAAAILSWLAPVTNAMNVIKNEMIAKAQSWITQPVAVLNSMGDQLVQAVVAFITKVKAVIKPISISIGIDLPNFEAAAAAVSAGLAFLQGASSGGGKPGLAQGSFVSGSGGVNLGSKPPKPGTNDTKKMQSGAGGGIAYGSSSGYAALLHGTEAVVPLPNGRSIPVQMQGGGGMVVNLTYAPAFSTASSQELLQNITPLLNDWYRRRLTS